jgi:hypothetical protein
MYLTILPVSFYRILYFVWQLPMEFIITKLKAKDKEQRRDLYWPILLPFSLHGTYSTSILTNTELDML